jgi:hypothetical protein
MPTDHFKCLACGSTDLCFGYQGTAANVFVPSGVFTFHGYKTRSYVCLRCGQMGHFMAKDKLDKLREKIKDHFESPFK